MLVVAATIPALVIILASGFERERLEVRFVQQAAQSRAEDISDAYWGMISQARGMLQILSGMPEVASADPGPCNALFERLLRQNREFYTLQVSRNGVLFASGSPIPGEINVTDRKYWREAVSNRRFAVGEYIVGRTVPKPQLNFAYPIFDSSSNVLAVVQAGFALEYLQSLLNGCRLPNGGAAVVTDHAGVVLSCLPFDAGRLGHPDDPALFAKMTNLNGFFTVGSGDERACVNYRQLWLPMEDGDTNSEPCLFIRVTAPEKPMLAGVRALMARKLGLLALAVALGLLAAWKMGGAMIADPVQRLYEAMQRFGAGDLTARAVSFKAGRELAQLGEGFNNMAERIASRERERELDKEAIRRSERRFRQLFNSCNDLMFVHEYGTAEKPGYFIEVNDAMCARLGYTREELSRMTPADINAPGMEPCDDIVARLLKDGRVSWEGAHCAKDGRIIPVDLSACIFELDGRNVVLTISRDISDRKESEQQKIQLEEQLRHSQKMEAVGRLAGGVAHDFNNILTAILGNAELLLEDKIDESTRLGVEEIRRVSLRAAGLTRQLLTFSRKQVVAPQVINVNNVIRDSENMIERLIGEHIVLGFHPAEDLPSISADPSQIDQIIVNLVVNARDAMPNGGRLIIETSLCKIDPGDPLPTPEMGLGEWVSVAISDTGCGMSPEVMQRLFEPFFTTKDKGKGTGLGLATAYGIVRQSGGAIGVQSEVGVGSRFTLYFPKCEKSASEAALVAMELPPLNGNESILLVEDEMAVRQLVRKMLQNHGYTVVAAPDGIAAMAVFESGKFDLLLTDVVMPGMNGYELSKALHSMDPGLKALFMSGHIDDQFVHSEISVGPGHFIQKPFKSSDLLAQLRQILDSKPEQSGT
jgi:PAS domain S-box-containing protein